MDSEIGPYLTNHKRNQNPRTLSSPSQVASHLHTKTILVFKHHHTGLCPGDADNKKWISIITMLFS